MRERGERFEIIGEAANRVAEGLRSSHAGFPWRTVISRGNALVHEYVDIGHERLRRIATRRIPELITVLEALKIPRGSSPCGFDARPRH